MDFATYDDLARLTMQAQSGNAEAFAKLYDKTSPILRLTIANKVGFAEAGDILQETYLVAWRNMDKIDPQSVVAYLGATARNLCSNYLRKRERAQGSVSIESEDGAKAAAVAASAPNAASDNPADLLEASDMSRRLREALVEELDDQERTAILLKYVLNLRNEDVAAQLDVSERTVKRITARALAALRRKLSFVPAGADLAAALGAAGAGGAGAGIGVGGAGIGDPVVLDGENEGVGGSSVLDSVPNNGEPPISGNAPDPSSAQASDKRWKRAHQVAAAAAVLAVLAVGAIAANLHVPEPATPAAPVAADPEPDTPPLLDQTWTENALTYVRLSPGTFPVASVWCTAEDGTPYKPLTSGAFPITRRSDADTADSSKSLDDQNVYVFDLPSGTYELHAADTAGNQSSGPLEVVLYPEP